LKFDENETFRKPIGHKISAVIHITSTRELNYTKNIESYRLMSLYICGNWTIPRKKHRGPQGICHEWSLSFWTKGKTYWL